MTVSCGTVHGFAAQGSAAVKRRRGAEGDQLHLCSARSALE